MHGGGLPGASTGHVPNATRVISSEVVFLFFTGPNRPEPVTAPSCQLSQLIDKMKLCLLQFVVRKALCEHTILIAKEN